MNDEKYIGLDVHQATISVAVMDASGKVVESVLETQAATILSSCLQMSDFKKSVSSKRTVCQAQSIHPGEPQAGEHIVHAIISGNGAALYCEATVPNTGKNHSTMRHGFAGSGLQYVSRIVFDPVGCTGAHQQFPEREGWPGACGAVVGDSASRQLAARVRIPSAPRSEPLDLGTSRLGRNVARRLAGNEAHHGRHPLDLR